MYVMELGGGLWEYKLAWTLRDGSLLVVKHAVCEV